MRADPHHHCYSVLFQFKLDLVPILSLLGKKTALLGVCCQPKFRKISFVLNKLESGIIHCFSFRNVKSLSATQSDRFGPKSNDQRAMQLHMNVCLVWSVVQCKQFTSQLAVFFVFDMTHDFASSLLPNILCELENIVKLYPCVQSSLFNIDHLQHLISLFPWNLSSLSV